jgi:septal ring factor EnvC (AmiA/AmiB activator)
MGPWTLAAFASYSYHSSVARKADGPASKSEVQSVKTEVGAIKDDVQVLKGDLQTLKSDVTGLKGDIARLDAKIGGVEKRLETKIDGVHRGLAVEIVKTNTRMGEMESRLTALIRQESASTAGRLDAFLAKMETYARETVSIPRALDAHGEKLRDHEVRIIALESPRLP